MTPLDRAGLLPDAHKVPDLLRPGLKLVFCGTALGRVSAQKRAYYAHPGNFFWRTLHKVGLTHERLSPTEYPRLLDHGIGLTDLCKAHYGNDVDLPAEAWNAEALRAKITEYAPRHLAFTSKTAASVFLGRPTGQIALGRQVETAGETTLWVLPSPSGQARRFWDEGAWRDLAQVVTASPEPS
ncbi:mismatch-specific DNA-glycosylase [Asticcacaulis sp. DW145]|jgi:TDG/mug DNA glycosylase family protein|uniref:Mismatch-specific DNA-glycosylase n=1 Tax=Asticcacaulis currens TaxID=2984210 RepID=A0ABT5II64_9CAUL|nr:mismatch-specific DNA-glycosylase [Asticcacaulis currens]MDC7695156.1 mismatch-specific DNA-glycosylase [Asticcacaulis currens]BEV12717.1 mismatch-specific DNA-glycosylase [Asticcacaulis sp. DW145]